MKMISDKRATVSIFRRRDRYDIPDWQRSEVWNRLKKQRLIDSIRREAGSLPVPYFIEQAGEDYLVEDGQQRLNAIWEFFSNELALSTESAAEFKELVESYTAISRVPLRTGLTISRSITTSWLVRPTLS